MYNPTKFSRPELADAIIREFPFATLITTHASGMEISHVPLVLEERDGVKVLVGHLARANRHAQVIGTGITRAVFHGPHAYVTPKWYVDHDVPTWNYVVAHVEGPVRLCETEAEIVECLRDLSAAVDPGWDFGIPDDLNAPGILPRAILGFELMIERVDVKCKLSQNRGEADQKQVIAGLRTRKEENSLAVAAWMERLL